MEGDCLLSSWSKVDNEEGGPHLKQQHSGQVSLSGVSPWIHFDQSWDDVLAFKHQSIGWDSPGHNKRNPVQFCGEENVLDYTYIACSPVPAQSLPAHVSVSREGTGWQDISPETSINTYCQLPEPRWKYLSHAVFHHHHFCCFLSSDGVIFISSGSTQLNRQHTEINLYNLKIILIGKRNIYLFSLWCSDFYCGKSSDPPIVIVLNISSLRGIKHWFIRVVHQLTRSISGIPWDIWCLH